MYKRNPASTLLIVFFITLSLLTGCQPKGIETETGEPQSENAPTEAAALPLPGQPVAINSDILLDPAVTDDPDSLLVSRYLYEGLVRLDENGEVQPGLADSWVISDDQLDYIFEIRANSKFSNGTPITTDTIVDNFNRWFDPQSPLHGEGKYPTWLGLFLAFHGERDAENRAKSPVDGIQKVDQNTVIVHLNRPVPELLEYLAQPAFAILYTDALTAGSYGSRESDIISSGAYMVSAWTDSGLTLGPNPNYWSPVKEELTFTWK
jgi:ABC-type oligopeptide transport system substrate-binding subunit